MVASKKVAEISENGCKQSCWKIVKPAVESKKIWKNWKPAVESKKVAEKSENQAVESKKVAKKSENFIHEKLYFICWKSAI